MTEKVTIRCLPTGVPGLDELLGGGIPEYSFNLIAGSPGCGKTTLAHQMMFGLATLERKAIYFTVLGEPPLKMLRYQQQFSFFDFERINASVHFVNMAEEAMSGKFDVVLARIVAEVEASSPALVFVDSFRSVNEAAKDNPKQTSSLQQLVQKLGMRLTGWQTTSFLIGEYSLAESDTNPVFTVADGLLWLTQSVHRNSMVRKLQVMKMRGRAQIPGLHTFRISDEGIRVFPRVILGGGESTDTPPGESRLSMGVPLLDEMLGGGLPSGYSMLIAGPAGSGKTILTTSFLMEGARVGENGVIASFEKRPRQSHSRKLDELVEAGQLAIIDTRALDLSIDETLYELTVQIERLKAKRVVIDSLSGFELALAPTFREDFRESLYRMVSVLTGMGVTVLMTSEMEDRYNDLRFSPYGNAFLTDAIIMLRYVEIGSRLERVMAVVKVRASMHSRELRRFEIDKDGIVIGDAMPGYEGLLSGQPKLQERDSGP
ncbi:ATPase domain-containing protein [Methylibium sp.]|uniref:ATPase domain-containing protein n=1 Tax=Methylibium sp. TaxID=2067992 RepID=UPI0017F26586|nr:ATPase domain-containing protein [Methylibium sp.]MBA3588567.1 AAA family ATPase [Methylibium sp.]